MNALIFFSLFVWFQIAGADCEALGFCKQSEGEQKSWGFSSFFLSLFVCFVHFAVASWFHYIEFDERGTATCVCLSLCVCARARAYSVYVYPWVWAWVFCFLPCNMHSFMQSVSWYCRGFFPNAVCIATKLGSAYEQSLSLQSAIPTTRIVHLTLRISYFAAAGGGAGAAAIADCFLAVVGDVGVVVAVVVVVIVVFLTFSILSFSQFAASPVDLCAIAHDHFSCVLFDLGVSFLLDSYAFGSLFRICYRSCFLIPANGTHSHRMHAHLYAFTQCRANRCKCTHSRALPKVMLKHFNRFSTSSSGATRIDRLECIACVLFLSDYGSPLSISFNSISFVSAHKDQFTLAGTMWLDYRSFVFGH